MSTKKYKGLKLASEVVQKYTGKATFGMFLSAARDSMGVSQAELARILGVPRAMLCDIEKGRQLVSPSLAIKIANKAGFSPRFALQLCIEDQFKKAKLKYKVEIKAA